jgi:hypothetical protein
MGPVEFSMKIIPLENLQQELEKLQREGWQMVPGMPPTVSYPMARVVQQAATNEGKGGITVDDSKVHIVRGG